MRSNRFAGGRRAFTLIELLVVLAIIGILLSLVVVAVHAAMIAAKRKAAGVDIANIRTALSFYEHDFGMLPPSGAENLFRCLSAKTRDGPGAYMEFARDRIGGTGDERKFLDSWGKPYAYVRLAAFDSAGRLFHVYSPGPNGIDETDDAPPDGVLAEAELAGPKGDDVGSW